MDKIIYQYPLNRILPKFQKANEKKNKIKN